MFLSGFLSTTPFAFHIDEDDDDTGDNCSFEEAIVLFNDKEYCKFLSVSKIVIKSAVVQTRGKAVWTFEEFYFFREPCLQSRLQAHSDELDKQEFPRALSIVSSELRPDIYIFSSDDFY